MARSRITEEQVLDSEFASEVEMREYVSTVSGSLYTYINDYYVKTDGTKGFSGVVSGVDPVEDGHLSTKYYVDQSLPLTIALTDRLETISGGWYFTTISPEFYVSPLFGNNVIWLSRHTDGTVEDVFWARAADNNTYLNWGAAGHFYLRDNSAVTHYDFTATELDAKDSDIRTTGVFYGDGSGLTNLSMSVSGTEYFDGYDSSGGTGVSTSWTDVPFGTERKKTAAFAHSVGGSEVTIGRAGTYVILARATTTITAGTARTDSSIRLVIDTGSGYVAVPGTTAIMYNRTLNLGETTGVCFVALDINAGDKIKLQVKRDSGSSTLQLLAGGSSLVIFNTRGVAGADGDTGPPGSGSTINVQDNYTTVSGSPFEVLNFEGDGVGVTNTSSGVATISYQPPTFGTWYAYAINDSQSSTNSTSYINKLTFTVNNVPTGNYRLGWNFEWRRNATGNDFEARVQVDNTVTVMEMNEESKDVDSWHTEGGFVIVSLLSGSHYFDLDYAGENSYRTSYIRRARMEFWRIS